jgi:Icc-related predicted phosphoesterase
MPNCFFVSDLHGSTARYLKLFELMRQERPQAVFLGGDLLPSGALALEGPDFEGDDFVRDFLVRQLASIRTDLGDDAPRVFFIFGNDDYRIEEATAVAGARTGAWEYVHDCRVPFAGYDVYGYAFVPPTPFHLKDWEKYDVSRFVDPGCVSPEAGQRSVPVPQREIRHTTIKDDLEKLVGARNVDRAIFLFHSPPYRTNLDRAALDGKMIDHVPLDVHVGSIAIQRFIEDRQPLVTLHGHIHESARITGSWTQRIGRTYCFSAAHDGPELSLVRFDPERLADATRSLV